MRDPFQISPLRRTLLQQALERFPDLDVSALEAHAALGHAADDINERVFAPLLEHGISRGRFNVLMHLSIEEMLGNEAPGPSGIAQSLGVTRATMTQLLDGLEHDRLVDRRDVGHDRRAQAIFLTDAGRDLFDRIVPSIAANVAQVFAPLNSVERQNLIALISKLTTKSGSIDNR